MSLVLTPSLDIKIDCYEGPLSVLIGLIKKNKVSIWDIQLSLITERFLEYVDFVQKMHLKIAEDFIDMASLLIYIKSKMLLPSREEDKGYDPKEELIERIIEYEKIRTMAESLNSLPVLYRDTFCREQKSIDGDDGFDLLHLCNIFFELMKRKEERFLVIREIKPTLGEKLAMLKSILDSTGLFVWNMKEQAEQAEKAAMQCLTQQFARHGVTIQTLLVAVDNYKRFAAANDITRFDAQKRNTFCTYFFNQLTQTRNVEITFERMSTIRIQTFLYYQFFHSAAHSGNVCLGSGKMEIHRNYITFANISRCQNIFGSTTLVSRQKIIHSKYFA